MSSSFQKVLNRMTLFIGFLSVVLILSFNSVAKLCANNPILNGIILGVFLFGVIVCFINMFSLVPEYKWLKKFLSGEGMSSEDLPPVIFRPVAKMLLMARLEGRTFISGQSLHSLTDMIDSRFEEQRDRIRYITNVLILLGLVGTFWGLIHTVQSFKDMLGAMTLDFDESADFLAVIKTSLAGPLSGMGVAFSSSFLGLISSLIVGFLFLQLNAAQNAIFRDLEEGLADKTSVGFEVSDCSGSVISDGVQGTLNNLIRSSVSLERSLNSSRDLMKIDRAKSDDVLRQVAGSFNKTMTDVKQVFKQYLEIKPKLDRFLKTNTSENKGIKNSILQLNASVKKMHNSLVSVAKGISKKEGKNVLQKSKSRRN